MRNTSERIQALSVEQKKILLQKLKDKNVKGLNKTEASSLKSEPVFKPGDNFAYNLTKPSNFMKTEFVKIPKEDPLADMVQVEAKSASLNFRDLMIAMGMYPPTPGIPSVMGSDYAGVITKVGRNVTNFKPGDKVILLSAGSLNQNGEIDATSHFCKYMNVHYQQVFPMPETIGFSEAACIPTVYITSYYALIKSARITKNDTVLIHSATGGVGLSALELCKWIGCKVFATAGNDEKRQVLKDKGIELVMDSRSSDFADQILAYTDGKGVDVILNTLSGDQMQAGLKILNFFGRFLQIDKKDISLNNTLELKNFEKGISFIGVDIGLLTRDYDLINQMFIELNQLIDKGDIQPIKFEKYPYVELGQALNSMSKSAHIGKFVIDFK